MQTKVSKLEVSPDTKANHYEFLDTQHVETLIEILENERVNGDVTMVSVIMKDKEPPSTLTLHNAFDLLNADSELLEGETLLAARGPVHLSDPLVIDLPVSEEPVTKESTSLEQSIKCQVPSELKKRSSQLDNFGSAVQLLELDTGRTPTTRNSPSSLLMDNFPRGRYS